MTYSPEANPPVKLSNHSLLFLFGPFEMGIKDVSAFVLRLFVDVSPVVFNLSVEKRVVVAGVLRVRRKAIRVASNTTFGGRASPLFVSSVVTGAISGADILKKTKKSDNYMLKGS